MSLKFLPVAAWFLLLAGACGAPPGAMDDRTVAVSISSASAQDRETERFNTWLDVKYREAVARSPLRSTFMGSRLNYDKWDDASPAAAEAEMAIQRAQIDEMRAEFDPATLTGQGRLSYRLAEYNFNRREQAFQWRDYNYTFHQMRGVQSRIPAFLISRHRVTSKSDAEAYIARLRGIETYLGQHLLNAERQAAKGIRPPAFTYDYVLSDARNIITGYPFGDSRADGSEDSPLMDDIRNKIQALILNGTITDPEGGELLFRAEEALRLKVGPTYQRLISFIAAERAHTSDEAGVWKLPDGEDYYAYRLARMTTTDMTADEIHELGLSEVARIQAEMYAIMSEVGFEGSLQAFFEFTRTDRRFFKPNTAEGRAQYLAETTALIDAMEAALPTLFNVFPKADLEVRAVEAFRERSSGKAFYTRPAPDGSRPGIYFANLYDMQNMPLCQMEALAYHEGIPGHHMQMSISQELASLPKFRKHGGYTVYREGWGLYAERLPKEIGFYENPYSDFGRLAMELWRAARLVVDTGLHHRKWTREQAIDYLLTNTPNPEGDCINAIDRYIVLPGQATAYKIGMKKILELREKARGELGDAFDIRAFHDLVLKNGPVPLAVLEETVDAWIAAETA
ncbi:MAG: DUF885 domain-containing protein [Henriciella sp.]|nr:DUF885 domain-containing protein [Henriciella sp.]